MNLSIASGVCAFGVGRGAMKPLFDAASLSELAVGPGAISTMMLSVLFAALGCLGAIIAGALVVGGEQEGMPVPLALAGASLAVALPSLLALFMGRRAMNLGATAFVRRREEEATRQFMTEVTRPITIDE